MLYSAQFYRRPLSRHQKAVPAPRRTRWSLSPALRILVFAVPLALLLWGALIWSVLRIVGAA